MNRSVVSARIKPNRSVGSARIKPNRSVVSTKNQRRKVDLPCEAEERQIVRQKLRLDLISIVSNIICFFNAVNTFFLILCGLMHFSLRLQLLPTFHCYD